MFEADHRRELQHLTKQRTATEQPRQTTVPSHAFGWAGVQALTSDCWKSKFGPCSMNPHTRVRLQLAGESYGLLVDGQPCNTAIVFVHGFWGDSEKTWWQFQTLPDR